MSTPRPTSLPTASSSAPTTSPSKPFTGTPTAEYPAYEYPLNPAMQPSPPFVSGRAAAGYFPPALVAQEQQRQKAKAQHPAPHQGPVPPRLVGMMAAGKQAGSR